MRSLHKAEHLKRELDLLRESMKREREYSPSRGERIVVGWLTRVSELPGKSTIRMALLILRLAMKLGRKRHILITPQLLAESSISRVAGYEGLVGLENARLVSVIRCHGRSPIASIVENDREIPDGE